MFDGFDVKKDAQARRRWFVSGGTSVAVYLVIGGLVAVVAGKTVARKAAPEDLDVTFRAEALPPAPEPEPPPPPPAPRPAPKVATVRKPGRALVEPTRVSDERAEDVADGAAIDPESLGDGDDAPAPPPPAPPPPAPPPPPARPPEPVDVADDLELAVALPGNRLPAYPADARKRGLEGELLLKLTISEDGEVIDVAVLGGAEPFIEAGLAAVRTWRYQPAREGGRAVPGSRIVRIPFRIRA